MATTDITQETLEATINDNDIVLLDFWAEWCGPCKMFAPVFEEAAEKHSDVKFGKVDTEAEMELASAFQIQSIPTLMAFRENVLVFRQPGALNAAQLEELITAVKNLDMEEVHAEVEKQMQEQDGAANLEA